ncbi:uncharacterized protein LOC117192924 [Drosophila miranda]|uniref:uncharacterized protein LOC117192924 n=1 Tax=Drosophila miranda TaxID=7229 RepID=UPI00143F7315|nr:uncharacterized protein LOC117192924 [Drosophila miranda]
MIAQFVDDHQNTWDELLPEMTLAINSSVSETTGFSPAFLLQGREARLPGALYDEVTPGTGSTPETATSKATRLKEVFAIVRNNIQRASQEQGRHYNLRRRLWRPAIGSLVLLRQHHLSNAVEGFAAKLAPKFDGPYRVKSFPSPNIAKLQHRESRKHKTANINDLREFHDHESEEPTDLLENADIDEESNETSTRRPNHGTAESAKPGTPDKRQHRQKRARWRNTAENASAANRATTN